MPVDRTISTSGNAVDEIVELVGAEAAQAGLAAPRIQRLQVAVEEAVVNVSTHAYGGRQGDIRIRIRQELGRLIVEIEDDGPAFDPLAALPPDTSQALEDRRAGGLGIMLIRRFTDDVRCCRERNRNILTLVTNLH